jgi:hypothetical protein
LIDFDWWTFYSVEMDGMPAEVVNRRGLYDVTLYRVVHDRSLRQETIFECILSIPATQYQIARRLIYYPGSPFFFSLFTLILYRYFIVMVVVVVGS